MFLASSLWPIVRLIVNTVYSILKCHPLDKVGLVTMKPQLVDACKRRASVVGCELEPNCVDKNELLTDEKVWALLLSRS